MSVASTRMPGLDGMRALAISAVVWHHTHAGVSYLPMTHNGFLGVDIFFVLSGFLITALLLREKAESGHISLRRFYIRRSLRIFPLYYAVLAVLAIYFQFSSGGSSQRTSFLSELPFHASYTSNWTEIHSMMAITWSLSTEEQFYLLWPLLLVLFGLSSVFLLSLFLVVNQAINFGWLDGYLAKAGIPYESLAILQCTFTPIILGALLAFAVAAPLTRGWLERATAKGSLAAGLVLLLIAANIPGDIRGWPRLSFQLATAALLAAIVLNPGHCIVRALEWRPLVYVGAVSYGVYLLHMLVLDAVRRGLLRAGFPTDELLFPLCLAGTIALAGLSYRCFEQPIMRLKDRLR